MGSTFFYCKALSMTFNFIWVQAWIIASNLRALTYKKPNWLYKLITKICSYYFDNWVNTATRPWLHFRGMRKIILFRTFEPKNSNGMIKSVKNCTSHLEINQRNRTRNLSRTCPSLFNPLIFSRFYLLWVMMLSDECIKITKFVY